VGLGTIPLFVIYFIWHYYVVDVGGPLQVVGGRYKVQIKDIFKTMSDAVKRNEECLLFSSSVLHVDHFPNLIYYF
jgi:hypothetical protein